MSSSRNIALMSLCLLASQVALAQGSHGSSGGNGSNGSSTAEQLARINESIALLNAQKAELELKAQIAAKHAEISKSGFSLPGEGDAMRARQTPEGPLPTVRSIEGMDGNLRAMVVIKGSVLQSVRQGERLLGDWTVTDITPNALTMKRGAEIVRLAPVN